jgi:hypothetical protein
MRVAEMNGDEMQSKLTQEGREAPLATRAGNGF